MTFSTLASVSSALSGFAAAFFAKRPPQNHVLHQNAQQMAQTGRIWRIRHVETNRFGTTKQSYRLRGERKSAFLRITHLLFIT